jgi:hypothetical protein
MKSNSLFYGLVLNIVNVFSIESYLYLLKVVFKDEINDVEVYFDEFSPVIFKFAFKSWTDAVDDRINKLTVWNRFNFRLDNIEQAFE